VYVETLWEECIQQGAEGVKLCGHAWCACTSSEQLDEHYKLYTNGEHQTNIYDEQSSNHILFNFMQTNFGKLKIPKELKRTGKKEMK
jgi:hypothetical protein